MTATTSRKLGRHLARPLSRGGATGRKARSTLPSIAIRMGRALAGVPTIRRDFPFL